MKSLILCENTINGQEKQLSEWSQINWKKCRKIVRNLRRRIFRARQLGQWKQLRRLQKLMLKCYANLLISVRKVTQENTGKRTAGVDKEVATTPSQRVKLVNEWSTPKAKPTRRVLIPKANGKTRPLGIPTIQDRAKQALLKLALEPEWEAKFELNSHGFRPGRSAHDAIEAIRIVISGKPKYVLDADIAQCFDRINHQKLLSKIDTSPKFRRQIKAWLKGGVMENNVFQPTESGTPQGGICSPLLANIALHGMQHLIESEYPAYSNGTIKRSRSRFGRDDVSQPKLIRYADDLVIICDELSVILHCRQLIEDWLSEIGLELKPSKTRVVHTLREYDGNQPGFDFLGFNIRQFPVGKHHSGKNSRQKILGFKTIISPSNQKVKEHYQQLADKVHHLKTAPQSKLINTLNPIIRGWCNYQTPWNSSQSYGQLNYLVFRLLWRWAKRRHPNKGNGWIARKYWKSIDGDNWVFSSQKEDNQFKLHKHSSYPAGQRWTKVKENRSPFDGDEIYWSTRLGDKYRTKDPQKARLLKVQKGKCHHCKRVFKPGDNLEKHHLIPNNQGGNNQDDNLVLLHLHCHDKIHRNQSRKRKGLS